MTCRPDCFSVRGIATAGIVSLLLGLAACSDAQPELTPLARAEVALAKQDGLGAEIILRNLLSDGTPQTEIAAFLGEAELQQEDFYEARQWLQSGEFSADTRGHGFQMLGRLETAEGNLPKAGQAFDRALETMPENPELWVDIGRLRYLGGEQEQAVEASIHAVELGPNNSAALRFRAQLILDAQGIAAALPWYQAALDRNPEDLALMGDYAAALGESGQARKMLVIVRRMIELDENHSHAYFLQAVLAARGGQFALARQLLTRSSDADRATPVAMMLSAIIDMQTGNFASSAQVLEKLERMQPDNQRIRLLFAKSLSLGEYHRELISRFEDGAMLAGSPPYLATLVGRSYEALNRRDKAAPLLDFAAKGAGSGLHPLPPATTVAAAAAGGPQTGRDAVSLVRSLMLAGQTAAAVLAADEFLRRAPGSADALGLAGDAYLAAGRTDQASAHYARAGAIRQSWPLTRRMYAAEIAGGRIGSALTLLEHQLVNNSANSEAAILLAEARMELGNAGKAAALLDWAIANGADRSPRALLLRAKAALATGDTAFARKTAMRVHSLQKMNPAAGNFLAEIRTVEERKRSAEARLR